MSRQSVSAAAVAVVAAAVFGPLMPLEAAAQNRPAPCAPVSASGTITKANGTTASFAAVAGCRDGQFWGSVSFADQETRYEVTSTQITGYIWNPNFPNVREICGRGLTDRKEEVQFRMRLVDTQPDGTGTNGEFGFATDNQHTAGSRFYILKAIPLEVGYVRIPRTNRPGATERVLANLKEFRMCGDLNTPK